MSSYTFLHMINTITINLRAYNSIVQDFLFIYETMITFPAKYIRHTQEDHYTVYPKFPEHPRVTAQSNTTLKTHIRQSQQIAIQINSTN